MASLNNIENFVLISPDKAVEPSNFLGLSKKIAEQIDKKNYIVKKLSTENKELYGSVKPTEISKIIKDRENIELSSSLIQPVKEIKSVGVFKVILNLHSEIESSISIKVVPEELIN